MKTAAIKMRFEHQDWQGTERVRTDVNGGTLGTYTSLPYGDNYSFTGSDDDPYHFASLNHDGSYDDHAQFREYYNLAGRWLSPDPYMGSYDPTNPQSFNRYAYALNNPLSSRDPSGLYYCVGGFGPCRQPNFNPNDDGDSSDLGGEFQMVPVDYYDFAYTSIFMPGQTVYGSAMYADGTVGYADTTIGDLQWGWGYSPAGVGTNLDFTPPLEIVLGAPNKPAAPTPQPQKESYWKCVGKTTVEDAAWGAVGTAAVAVVVPTVGFAIGGSSIGPEGTVAGAGLGFAVGVAIAPGAALDSLVLGVPVGLFHGLVGCAF